MHEEFFDDDSGFVCSDERPADISQADLDEMLRDAHERDAAEQSEQVSASQDSGGENCHDHYITNADENKSDKPIVTPDSNTGTSRDKRKKKNEISDEEYHKRAAKDIDESKRRLSELPSSDRRGLDDETYQQLGIGCIPNWKHPKSPNSLPTPRFIARLGDANDPPAYNAIMTPSGRERFGNSELWEAEKCLTAVAKLVFHPSALTASLVAITEGEMDTASIWQCLKRGKLIDAGTCSGVDVCALGGTDGAVEDLIKRLESMEVKPRVILLFDGDDTGRTDDKKPGRVRAKKLQKQLWAIGVVAVCEFFEDVLSDDEKKEIGDKPDANQILKTKGDDYLYYRFARIVKKAQGDFKQAEEEMKRWREYEQAQSTKSASDDLKPSTRENQSAAKGNYDPEIQNLIDEINNTITCEMLEQKGIIEHSKRGKARPEGYVCLYCGSGTKTEKTGELCFTKTLPLLFRCRACGKSGNVLTLLSKVWSIPRKGKEFFDLLKKTADEFNIPYDKKIFEHQQPKQYTTQTFIPDCPVDLILPRNVLFNDEGITLVESRRDDKQRYITAAETPIVPTKILRDENSGLVQYELAILTQGTWRRHVVDGRTIQSPRCIDKLANFGALFKATPLCEYFTRIIAANSERLKMWRVFAQPGWKDDKFQQFIYPTGGENYIVDRAGYKYKTDYSERGNADEWRQFFGEAMKAGGRIARIFCGVAVAAPLIRPLKVTNMQAHLFGGVNAGKTALEILIASIWGNPQELLMTFESSPKRRQADAAAYNDLPTFYDELETVRGQRAEISLTQSVYAFFNGKGNQNLNVDGTARDKFKFTGSRLSTGERQILKVADQYGAYKRLVPLECKEKIFAKKLATRIYRFTEDNFGHFGREWTTYIADHLTAIRDKYEAMEQVLLTDEIHEETQLRTICAAGVAYQFFAQYVGLQDGFDDSTFMADVTKTIDELPTVEESSDSARALDVLKDFVTSNEGYFYIETANNDAREYPPTNHGVNYGKLFLDGGVAIIPTELRRILYKEGFASPEMLIRTWNGEHKIETTAGRGTYRRHRINKKLTDTIYFKPKILSEPREDKSDDNITPPPI